MKQSKLHLESTAESWSHFSTAASLHSHTLCSQETLTFLYKLARTCTPVRIGLHRGKAKYQAAHGTDLDLKRAWWTPPAAPRDAWLLECHHIENRWDKHALVSLTDHDTIEAPLSLHVLEECRGLPVSVEWTVPFGPTFFHLGVHNLPSEKARELMAVMAAFTSSRKTLDLFALMQTLSSYRETLIVFNHPCWDENDIGCAQHLQWAGHFAAQYRDFIHAFELNGLRPWPENRLALQMAYEFEKPVISGGDRHAFEPNTILDLTNAACFSEYVAQVRSGHTDILVTDQYREPFQLRILQNVEEIMQDYDEHGRGWRRWSDRVFYRCDDGVVRSVTALFANHIPRPVQIVVKTLGLIRHRGVRRTVRHAFPKRQELAL